MALICRTCLQTTVQDSYYPLDTFDNNGIEEKLIPKEMLQICIPEMDVYISNNPGICKSCYNLFEKFYEFKNRCLESEDRIMNYIEKFQLNSHNKVDLACVIHDICQIDDFYINADIGNNIDNVELDIEGVFKLNDKTDEVVVINLAKNSGKNGNNEYNLEDNNILLYCNKCSFVTMNPDKLANHNCFAVMTTDKHKCPYCDYSTSRRERINRHIAAKHSRNSQYQCEECEFAANTPLMLRRHKKVAHNIIPTTTTATPITTTTPTAVAVATTNTTMTTTPTPTPPTPTSVSRTPTLPPIQTTPPSIPTMMPTTTATTSPVLPIGRHLSTSSQLSIKMYECNMCQYATSSNIDLTRHKMNEHQQPVQYCQMCPYQTRDKSNFRKHMYTHNEKPLQCTLCVYQSLSPYQLTKHYKKFH